MKHRCNFIDYTVGQGCVYRANTECEDIIAAPGNGDALCYMIIENCARNVRPDPSLADVEEKPFDFMVFKEECNYLDNDTSGELEFCSHGGNPENTEGNCYNKICPRCTEGSG